MGKPSSKPSKANKPAKAAKPAAQEGYDASAIQVLEGLEAVRRRPAMYIGDTSTRGLHHLVEEVVDNSIDEAMAGHAKNVQVTVHQDNSVTVVDDGRGIPVDQHKTEKKSALEVVLTKLHAGGKFDSRTYKVAGGLHGVGVSVVNGLAEWLEAEVRRDGKVYRQRYQRGKPVSQVTVVGKATGTGTRVTFKADREIFTGGIVYSYDTLANRLRELAFLNKGLKVTLKDERNGKEASFQFSGGIKEFVEHLNTSKQPLHSVVYFEDAKEHTSVEIALQYNDSYSDNVFSFANNINTVDGGTHLSGFKSALTRTINQYCKAKNLFKGDNMTIEGGDTLAGLTAVVSVKIPQPQFEGQTKAKLGTPEVEGIVASICNEQLSTYFEEHPTIASKIADKCLVEARARERARHERELVRRKGLLESSALPGKLADCSERDAELCEIYIVEGDSAGGCFSGDTKVALTDGRALSFQELVEEWERGKQNFCYTILPNGQIGIEEIRSPRKTRAAAEVLEVTLDNDEQIVCTPDHLVMLRDGSYRPAKALQPGDSLRPLYRQLSRLGRRITLEGYEMVFDPAQERWIFTHLLADEHNLRHGRYAATAGAHRHHRDFDKRNNNPTNIWRLSEEAHLQEHRQHAAKTLQRQEVLEKLRAIRKTKAYRAAVRKTMLKPAMREALRARARRRAYNQTYLRHSLRLLAQAGNAASYEQQRRAKRNNNLLKFETLCRRVFDGNQARALEAAARHNHKVVSVRKLSARTDVYDLEVPGTHNFALASGVFVHNSAKQGRDRRFQAILPIKGKILNVEKARLEKILTNEEIRTVITALGCGIGNEFNIEKLRYHKVVLMADADVDGNHIRTLLLTFFYRQMLKLVEAGHIYIAQPPLYKIKRGKREEYIDTDEQMSNMLLELGSEGETLTHAKSKKTFKDKTLLEILRVLADIERLSRGLGRYRVDPAAYFKLRTAKKGLPLYLIRMDGEQHFLCDDAELAKFAQKHDLDLEELEKAPANAKAQFAELYEASELDELAKKLDKHGLSLEEYHADDGKAAFKMAGPDTPSGGRSGPKAFGGLRDVLVAVEENGRQGMNIQRYKGLGEMNPQQLWDTTMDPAKRTILQVKLDDVVEAERIFTTLMGEAVEPRKQFIEEHALEVKNLDI